MADGWIEKLQAFVAGEGYEVVVGLDGGRHAAPMKTSEALAALDALVARLAAHERVAEAAWDVVDLDPAAMSARAEVRLTALREALAGLDGP